MQKHFKFFYECPNKARHRLGKVFVVMESASVCLRDNIIAAFITLKLKSDGLFQVVTGAGKLRWPVQR